MKFFFHLSFYEKKAEKDNEQEVDAQTDYYTSASAAGIYAESGLGKCN